MMPTLYDLIVAGNYSSATEAYQAILEPTIEVRDDQLYTWAGIALIVDAAGAEELRFALEASGMGWVVHQLGGSGIQLSNPLTQRALLTFAQNGVPGCDLLAETGIKFIPPWKHAGLESPPSLEDVTKLYVIADTRKTMTSALQLVQSKSTALNAWLDALDTGSMTAAQVQTYCDSLLSSEDGNPEESI